MKTNLKAALESVIEEWLINNADHEDRPEHGLVHPKLHIQMTEAAGAVYDATFDAQEYQRKES